MDSRNDINPPSYEHIRKSVRKTVPQKKKHENVAATTSAIFIIYAVFIAVVLATGTQRDALQNGDLHDL